MVFDCYVIVLIILVIVLIYSLLSYAEVPASENWMKSALVLLRWPEFATRSA